MARHCCCFRSPSVLLIWSRWRSWVIASLSELGRPVPDIFLPSEIRLVPVRDLVPYARNARLHPDAQVAQVMASIQRWQAFTGRAATLPDGATFEEANRRKEAPRAAADG